jgi:predicted nucleotidyltransferase
MLTGDRPRGGTDFCVVIDPVHVEFLTDDSDVDVLVITDKAKTVWDKANMQVIIERKLDLGDPFELHAATREEYENWYRRFIDAYEEF